MNSSQSYHITVLKDALCQRQKKNPRYSLKAYARDLDLHCSTLSQVFKGKRRLPYKRSFEIAEKLGLEAKTKTLFIESVYKTKTKLDDIKVPDVDVRHMIDDSYFKVIAEWEHFALDTLLEIKNFNPTIENISAKLGISETRASVVIDHMLTTGLLKIQDGKLSKAFAKLRTTEDIKSSALKASHLETLEMGKQKLAEVEVDLRDFSSMTVALDVEKIPELKSIIREFRQKVNSLALEGRQTDVFQLAIQLYPLSDTNISVSTEDQ